MSDIKSYAKGRYEVVEKLGEGGMAEVFLALDTFRDIPVAIKRPRDNVLLHDKKNRRFMQEVGIHGRVIHPNVVLMLDARTEVLPDGRRVPYMVVEYAPGVTAHDCCESHGRGGFGPLPPGAVGRIMLSVIGALRAMHAHGVYHRDIKPANIMVGWNAVGHRSFGWDPMAVKLLDFGIARNSEEDNSFTKAGTELGTWFFMAPEQKRDAKSVDHRADIYSAGATLWALITGETPCDLHIPGIEDTTFLMVPEPWRKIVFGATRYLPGERAYQSVEELGVAIDSALDESADSLGPFEYWLEQKKIASPAEAALRRARGIGLTIVAEMDDSAVAGHTKWFQEEPVSESNPAPVADAPIAAKNSPAKGFRREDPMAPLPKSRARHAAAAAGLAAMAALAVFSAASLDGEEDTPVETAAPVVAPIAVVPEPSLGVVSVTPVVDVAKDAAVMVEPKPKEPGRVVVVATTPDPSSLRGGETSHPTAPVVVIPVAAPEPEKGSVHLVSGATSISLVGNDGASHPPGRVAPGTYSIRATFATKGEVVNAGTVTVLAGQDLSVTCLETMALCKAR